jgi:hypothetical protein
MEPMREVMSWSEGQQVPFFVLWVRATRVVGYFIFTFKITLLHLRIKYNSV